MITMHNRQKLQMAVTIESQRKSDMDEVYFYWLTAGDIWIPTNSRVMFMKMHYGTVEINVIHLLRCLNLKHIFLSFFYPFLITWVCVKRAHQVIISNIVFLVSKRMTKYCLFCLQNRIHYCYRSLRVENNERFVL